VNLSETVRACGSFHSPVRAFVSLVHIPFRAGSLDRESLSLLAVVVVRARWDVNGSVVHVPRVITFNTQSVVSGIMGAKKETVQFRSGEVGEAVSHLRDLRIEGLNVSKLAREGLKDKLQEVTTADEKATIFGMYQRGEIEEGVARVFLGEHIDTMAADAEEVRAAVEDDTSELVQ
jgi:hypothetical protein